MQKSCVLLILVLAVTVGCTGPEPPAELTLVHATDPHLFEEPDRLEPDVREFQEGLNAAALKAFLDVAGSVGNSPRRVVVLTGDFGIDRRWTDQAKNPPPKPSHRRSAQVKSLADVLRAGAVADVYVVAGNNDLDDEIATQDALDYVAQYFQDVQKELEGTRVRLYDLTACYRAKGAAPAGCVADIPGTAVSLVGFPSYSFKNTSARAFDVNLEVQQAHMKQFATLIGEARDKHRKVVVLSHVPELDDPNTLALQRFTKKPFASHGNAERPKASSWNVSRDVLTEWKKLTESPTVLAVLAGHFHDSHREIYRRPYRWSSPSPLRADLSKLFLAPPLAVKYQDTSPIQARGFSVLRLSGEELNQQFYWFDAVTSTFEPEQRPDRPAVYPKPPLVPQDLWDLIVWPGRALSPTVLFLWNLGGDLKTLERMVVIAIAFLLAFLTAAKLWTVPRTPRELSGLPEVASTAEPSPDPAKAKAEETPLTSNLGKTVLSGLAGLATISLLDSFWDKSGFAAKGYYVVWFVVLFFVLLIVFAGFRGVVEACRIRIASEHRPPEWRPRGKQESEFGHRARYWSRRLWLWVLSWRPTVLVFLDTSLSVLFGENVLRNAVLSDMIARLQHSMILAIDHVRGAITISVRRALIREGIPAEDLDDSAVRVNVSVLAPDGGSAYYVSWAPGSPDRAFDRHSVAWVAISAGLARWWRKRYEDDKLTGKIVIFDNTGRRISDREGALHLQEFFQPRGPLDYEAFIVLPVPRRAASGDYWKAGIHISFSREEYFTALWPLLEPPGPAWWSDDDLKQFYDAAPRVLDEGQLSDDELRAVLHEAVDVVAEVLRRFNAVVYQTYVRPRLLR
jgi:hypothetical protein